MNLFFLAILQSYGIPAEGMYDELPLITRVLARNDITVFEDSSTTRLVLPPRAAAKNLTMAERMRRYIAQRSRR